MDTSVAKDMIRVIRDERDKRERDFRATEEPGMGDLWPYMGEPFFNEFCLALLVALRHHVERELVLLAARVTSDGRDLGTSEYKNLVKEEQELLRGKRKKQRSFGCFFLFPRKQAPRKNEAGWGRLEKKLKLKNLAEWKKSMEILRLLANAYKHEPMATSDKDLIKLVGIQKGLASSLDLPEGADYCDIADELVSRVDRFLAEVKAQQSNLSRVRMPLADPTNRESFEG